MILRGLSSFLRSNFVSIYINTASPIAAVQSGRNTGSRLGPLPSSPSCLWSTGYRPMRSVFSLSALKPVFPLGLALTNEPHGAIQSFPMTQSRCYTSRIKPRKKKPIRDLEPVVHSLSRYYDLDPSLPKLHLDEVEELKTADENVKKLFSLEFASNAEIKEYKSYKLMQELKDKIGIEQHASKNLLPLRIARLTMAVRNCGKHVIKNPKDKVNKRKMLINIDRRRKFLKRLRGRNHSHFESIQNELGIKWVPVDKYNWQNNTRRQIERRVVKNKAHWERIAAKKEFAAQRRNENMIEIVRLKKELGKDLTEEEKQYDKET